MKSLHGIILPVIQLRHVDHLFLSGSSSESNTQELGVENTGGNILYSMGCKYINDGQIASCAASILFWLLTCIDCQCSACAKCLSRPLRICDLLPCRGSGKRSRFVLQQAVRAAYRPPQPMLTWNSRVSRLVYLPEYEPTPGMDSLVTGASPKSI